MKKNGWTKCGGFLAAAVLAVMAGGCARDVKLVPAVSARTTQVPYTAFDTAPGVTLTARTDAWRGTPRDLNEKVIPVFLRLANEGDGYLKVGYADIALVHDGRRYAALPPFEIDKEVVVTADHPVYTPRFRHRHFYGAHHIAPYYDGAFPAWNEPLSWDPFYYDRYYPRWTLRLPTRDMIEHAFPEGITAPGGVVEGFVYFELPPEGVRAVDLVVEPRDPAANETVAKLEIPFIVK